MFRTRDRLLRLPPLVCYIAGPSSAARVISRPTPAPKCAGRKKESFFMARKSPIAIVKEKFSDKASLVEAVKAFASEDLWLGRTSKDRGGNRDLSHVSNAKLLRLHSIFTEVKDQFGTRAKLVDAILESEKRAGDSGFRKRLEEYPVPRLYDAYKSSVKRNRVKKTAAA